MRFTRNILIPIIFSAALAPTNAFAISFRVEIREQLLNKLADAVGSISYSGQHVVRAPDYPCLRCTQYWGNICVSAVPDMCAGPVLMSAGWSATVSNINLSITSSGIQFSGTLNATYGGLPFTTAVAGNVDLDIVSNQIRLRVDTVNIPLVFDVPGLGPVTIATIPVALPYSVTLPVNGIGLRTDADNVQVTAYTQNLTRTYLTDRVRLSGDLSFQ